MNGFRVFIDDIGPSEWDDLLLEFDDASLYQTWEYATVLWGDGQASRLVLRDEDGVAVACAQVRIATIPGIGWGIANLTHGPVWRLRNSPERPDVLRAILRAIVDEYSGRRGLCLRISPRDLSADGAAVPEPFSTSGFRRNEKLPVYRTFLLDLSPPLEQIRKSIRQKWRNQLNRAEKNGLEVTADSGETGYRVFLELASQMLKRKGFTPGVDYEKFLEVQLALPESHRLRTWVCRKEGVPVCAAVSAVQGTTGEYLLGATGDLGLELKGAYLLQWEIVKWLKENGFRHYDLGGINPKANPGVYHFKEGLGGAEVRGVGKLDLATGLKNRVLLPVLDASRRRD